MDLLETKFATECTIRMKWKVNESALKEALEKEDALFSSPFNASNIPGVKYYLSLQTIEKNPYDIYVYLHVEFEMIKTLKANFMISVKSASKSFNCKTVFDKSNGRGRKLCIYEELFNLEKKFFADGIMEVELEGILKPQGCKRKAAQSLSATLWEDEKDFTIVIDGKELKVHKVVLCAASSVFKADLKPVGKRPMRKKLNITDFDYETVKLAIEVCYERDIIDRITDQNSSQLLEFADRYEIEPLSITVQNVLAEKLSEENVVKFANISIKSKAVELQEYCICYLMKFVGKNTVINDIKKLNSEITDEIARRSIFSTSE